MCAAVKIGRLGKFDLNPRGELWRKDENRFGHKFLSKFGWSQGKGLGKNEDGISENLKVRMKIGNTGVGWDEKLPIGIDYREYDSVLEDLSKKFQKPGEVKNEEYSLEKRSQQFKNRIHYQKFVRGKDISRYSEKDMSCIFLSKQSEEEMESTPKESTVTNTESRPADPAAKESLPTFNSQLSIADYFAMKMKNKMGSSLTSTAKESKTCEESSQSETDAKSKKRKHEFKSSKKVKRMKPEPDTSCFSKEEESASESSSSSQEAPDEILTYKEQFQHVEECNSQSMKKKKKLSKKAKKLLKLKQDTENNQQEKINVVEKNSTEEKSLEDPSCEESSNSTEESINMTEKEVPSKKRKKEHKSCKKAKIHRLEEVEVEKYSQHSDSDDKDKNSSEECGTKTEKQSRKESKKHKNKLSNLKSCLKSLNNNKYSFKEKRKVTFRENELVSYKIIENVLSNNFDSDVVLETNEQLLSCSDEDCTDSEVQNEAENVDMNHVDDSNSRSESSSGDAERGGGEDVPCHENLDLVEDNTVPECFKLPKPRSVNYDSWLETQRIAARMKVYKNMARKMKKHPILKKTNLLDIKGYGNWGL